MSRHNSEGREEEEVTTRGPVKGGSGGVASLIRATKRESGGLAALERVSREDRSERSKSTQVEGVNPVTKPVRSTRRFNSVSNDQATPTQSNGDVHHKVPLLPQTSLTEQRTHNTECHSPSECPPPKPPRTGETSPSDFLSLNRGQELECPLDDNEGEEREEDYAYEEEEEEVWEQEEARSQSSDEISDGYMVNPQPVTDSPSAKRPMLPPSGRSRDSLSDHTLSSSPANVKREGGRKVPLLPPPVRSSRTPPTPTKTTPPATRTTPPATTPTRTRTSITPTRTTPTATTPTTKRSPMLPTPPNRVSLQSRSDSTSSHSGRTSIETPAPNPSPNPTPNHAPDDSLRRENELLRQRLKELEQQVGKAPPIPDAPLSQDQGMSIPDPLSPEGGRDLRFRSRSRSVSPGEDEERDKFPSGEPRPPVAKPVPLPRLRAQTVSSASDPPTTGEVRRPPTLFSASSVPATMGFSTPQGEACTGDNTEGRGDKPRGKVPMLPPGSSSVGSPVPKPRSKSQSTEKLLTDDTTNTATPSSSQTTPPVPKATPTPSAADSKSAEDKQKAVQTLQMLLPSLKSPLPPVKPPEPVPDRQEQLPVTAPVKPVATEKVPVRPVTTPVRPVTTPVRPAETVTPARPAAPVKQVSSEPKVTSPRRVPPPAPASFQSAPSRAIPVPRQIATTSAQSWVPKRPDPPSNTSIPKPETAPLSSSVPPPSLLSQNGNETQSGTSKIIAPLNSVTKPVPSSGGKAKYKKVTLTDSSWIKSKDSVEKKKEISADDALGERKDELTVRSGSGSSSGSSAAPFDRSGSSSSTVAGTGRSGSGTNTPTIGLAPYRSHPILPGPKTVQQPFIPTLAPSPEPMGKVTPPQVPTPPLSRSGSESKKKRWGRAKVTSPDSEKKVSRRHSFTKSASVEEDIAPLQSDVKGKKTGGRWGKRTLTISQQDSRPGGGKKLDSRPISMMVDRERKKDLTASAIVTSSMPRGVQAEDAYKQQKKKGFFNRHKKTSAAKVDTTPAEAPEAPEGSDSGSDDEKGGTIKRMPKLRHVERSDTVDDDSEPEYPHLFEYVFVVSLKSDSKGKLTTELTYTFPPTSKVFSGKDLALQSIPQFCFPDIDQWKPTKRYKSESYSFVLTDIEGNRRFGYCRRLLPEGSGPRLPEVFCIVSPLGCFSLYEDILDNVEERRANSSSTSSLDVFNFLKAISANPFPRPGRSVQVKAFGARGSGMETLTFNRPMDSRLEHVDFSLLFSTLSQRKIIQLFSSLLMERRVIFTATSLSLTTGCAHALMALLYPFEWQHVFIPVLPSSLIDFVCSPLPYIIGLHPASCQNFDDMEMEEAVIINLDKSKFIKKIGDETSILPSKLFQFLEGKLSASTITSEYSKRAKASGSSKADEVVVNTFMTFFAYLYGDYHDYMKSGKSGQREFERDKYIQKFTSKSTKRFLEAFHLTQMFENFIEQRENPSKAETVAASLFETKLPELKGRCQDIEIFSSKSRFDRWKMKKDFAK